MIVRTLQMGNASKVGQILRASRNCHYNNGRRSAKKCGEDGLREVNELEVGDCVADAFQSMP